MTFAQSINHPLRTFITKQSRNRPGNDSTVDPDAVAVKRRLDDLNARKEREAIFKEVWDGQ